uniref:Uncharacterized protein n=1 Tax=Physcomitrium patens TaxID=3218 RepID=A0A2K1KFQ5_PHYPA|nr:hypothetical protein PHYPA_008990 [Physcomitrium patens]
MWAFVTVLNLPSEMVWPMVQTRAFTAAKLLGSEAAWSTLLITPTVLAVGAAG